MISKILIATVVGGTMLFASVQKYSTTSVLTLIGAKIAASQKIDVTKKYKRKDCPVCKGGMVFKRRWNSKNQLSIL